MEYETILAYINGAEDALEKVIDQYQEPLLRYLTTIVCDVEEAKDVLQETFIKAYEKRKSFRQGTSFNAWIYRIAYTSAIDSVRNRKRRIALIKKQSEHPQVVLNNTIGEPLYGALLSLSVSDRALLYGKVLDNMSYSELEQVLKVSESALRKRFERLRKRIADEVEEKRITYYEKGECT